MGEYQHSGLQRWAVKDVARYGSYVKMHSGHGVGAKSKTKYKNILRAQRATCTHEPGSYRGSLYCLMARMALASFLSLRQIQTHPCMRRAVYPLV